jgi:methionyl-tRNA formyltransferase
MRLSAVFLCGDRSPYGMAHLEPIAKYFDLKALIIADRIRWAHFRSLLSGGEAPVFEKAFARLFHGLRGCIRGPRAVLREVRHQKNLRAVRGPIHVVNDVNSSPVLKLIESFNPQLILSAAYPQILKRDLLTVAPKGAINFHPSLLPRFRGAHPHYWCLATGEKFGGITAHYMTDRIDDGDIIAQRAFELNGLYYRDLYRKIIEETAPLVASVAKCLLDETFAPTPQDESKATFFRNDREIHRRLDFIGMTANKLHDLIRAGGAYSVFRGIRTQVIKADFCENNRHATNGIVVAPGVIIDIDQNGVWVATRDRMFLVVKILSERNRTSHFTKWVAKKTIQIGERFE